MATKKKEQRREPTLDDLIAGGYRYVPLDDPAPVEAESQSESGFMRRALGDTGIGLLKGAIGVPEAMVGMADLVSGGRAGKLAESAGFRPKDARAALDEYLSPEQQAANAAVQNAEGFTGKLGAALANPSVIWQGAVESAPSMLGGGAVARGLLKAAPKLGAVAAAAIGEGAVSAGQAAEQIRQETPGGLLTGEQSAIAAGSGALTGAIGGIAGRLAQRLGIGDVDTMLAGVQQSSSNVQKGFVRRILEGAVSEGVLEELPQSTQEQVAQNMALGRPLADGVDHAAVLGMLSGGLMGGVAGPLLSQGSPEGNAIRDEKMPEVGPLTKALNAATETRAAQVDAGLPTMTADQATVEAKAKVAELDQKASGTKDETKPGPDGEPVTLPGTPGQILTTAEEEQKQFLAENQGNPEVLARAQGSTISPLSRNPDAVIPGAVDAGVALDRIHETLAQDAQIERVMARQLDVESRPLTPPPAAQPTVQPVAPETDDASPAPEPTDILHPKSGKPWRSRQQVVEAQKKNPDTVIASVAGGYVLRPVTPKEQPNAQSDMAIVAPLADRASVAGVPVADRSGGDLGLLADDTRGGMADPAESLARRSEPAEPVRAERAPDAAVTPAVETNAEAPATKPDSERVAPAPVASAPVEQPVMPAGLYVEFGGKRFQVESVADAQRKWVDFRDKTGEGVSGVGNGVRVVDGAGRFVARISYNGRAWATEDDGKGTPEAPLAEAPVTAPTLTERVEAKKTKPLNERVNAKRKKADAPTPPPATPEAQAPRGDTGSTAPVAAEVVSAAGPSGVEAAGVKPRRSKDGHLTYRFKTNEDMDGQVHVAQPGFRKGVNSFEVTLDRVGGPKDEKGRTKFYPTVTVGKYRSEAAAITAAEKAIAEHLAHQSGVEADSWKRSNDRRTLQDKVESTAKDGAVVASVGASEEGAERKFYVTMVRGDRVARLAGPFDTKAEADGMVASARTAANEADPRSSFDAFGVSAVESKSHKAGVLNEKLGIKQTTEPTAAPEAESQSPAPEAGDSGVAPTQDGGGAAPNAEPAFNRSNGKPANTDRIQTLVDAITDRWENAPEVVVAQNFDDPKIPQEVRDEDTKQRSQGASGQPEGFYYKGKVYLLADQIDGAAGAVRVLFHETLGHHGLRGTFGKELGGILDRVAQLNPGKVRTKARQYGLDFDKLSERRQAAEEVLAEMAQTSPQLGWVRKAIAAIRSFLRDHVPGFAGMKFTDADIITSFILPARAWVKGGAETTIQRSAAPMFSRSLAATIEAGVNSAKDVNLPAQYKVGDLLNSTGKTHWWHKSVGTMFNLAKRYPDTFGKVFDAVQSFINDTSYYATEAANLAPKLLPKLEHWIDIFKSPISAKDTNAIAASIFEGTWDWARDESGKAIKWDDLKRRTDALSTDGKAKQLMRAGHVSEGVLRMWEGLPIDQYEKIIEGKFEKHMLPRGTVFSDAELRGLFNLNDAQIGLYREARASFDKSLTNLAISDMLRHGGKDVEALRDAALDTQDVVKAGELLRDHLYKMAEEDPATKAAKAEADKMRAEAVTLRDDAKDAQEIAKGIEDADRRARAEKSAKRMMDQADKLDADAASFVTQVGKAARLNETGDEIIDKANRAQDLMNRGYAPLARFGKYSVYITEQGQPPHYEMFETKREASRFAREARVKLPRARIEHGTVSQEAYKMFAGLSPEVAEMFGEILGLDQTGESESSKAFQEYLKRAKANGSAMKRLIERKGVAGYNTDAGRVLASFVYSNARLTSSNLHAGSISDAVEAIPKTQGEMKDMAVKLADYVQNPQEEAQAFRGLLFAQYIGGSVASAMVNLTQPLTMTFPYLSQFGGVKKAGAQLAKAFADLGKPSTGDKALDAALKYAEETGIVSPQEVHQLIAQAGGKAALKSGDGTMAGDAMAKTSNAISKLALGWGKLFGMAEQVNRRVTFIAAYRTAVEQGIADPAKFAAEAIAQTQGVYNKGNKPRWARGAVGGTLFVFKQYGIAYVELISRMAASGPEGRKAAVLALAVLFFLSGADGLPFENDLEDVVDAGMQRLGYNFSTKRAKQEFFEGLFGEAGAQFVTKGISGLPGVPIDVSGRMGLGGLIPGTGLLLKKQDHTRDLMEFLGPAGDFAQRIGKSAGQLVDGDVAKAAETLSPVAARNVTKAADMLATGMYRDDRGRKVIETTPTEAILKGAGFQPNTVAKVQRSTGQVQGEIALTKLRESEIADLWAQGVFEKDTGKVDDARSMLRRWNESNPATPISISTPQLRKRILAMRMTKAERIAATSPKQMRATVRRELAGSE